MAGKNSMKDKMDNFGKGNKKPDTEKTYGSPAMAAKPDFLDLDKDGNTSEPMKNAAKAKGSPAKIRAKGAGGHGYTDEAYATHQNQSIVKNSPEHVAAHSGSPAEKKYASMANKLEPSLNYKSAEFDYDEAADAGVFDKEKSSDRKIRRAQRIYKRKSKK